MQMNFNCDILINIASELLALPSVEHAGANILNVPLFAEAAGSKTQIAKGACEAIEHAIQVQLMEAQLHSQTLRENSGLSSILTTHTPVHPLIMFYCSLLNHFAFFILGRAGKNKIQGTYHLCSDLVFV
ncbi:hypothetical protein SCLCIDRAFT_34334 [Scleroderma citrinum Foug A]|uniref:Uncharacterized protein n=1 Tax=Scleroderma citrinum Foug A TaxID=1036808 RepID=A0A0C3D2N8_9AGAM|nr:hypothetical protein SCLCIDRAFT_34334 [Scleroderma citrinum Foug A]